MQNNLKTLSGFYFGQTVNVHSHGACIQAKPHQIPAKGDALTLQVMSASDDLFNKSDVSVRIIGEVAWVDRQTEIFGVCFQNGD